LEDDVATPRNFFTVEPLIFCVGRGTNPDLLRLLRGVAPASSLLGISIEDEDVEEEEAEAAATMAGEVKPLSAGAVAGEAAEGGIVDVVDARCFSIGWTAVAVVVDSIFSRYLRFKMSSWGWLSVCVTTGSLLSSNPSSHTTLSSLSFPFLSWRSSQFTGCGRSIQEMLALLSSSSNPEHHQTFWRVRCRQGLGRRRQIIAALQPNNLLFSLSISFSVLVEI
jgi:hypothetical protein